MNLFNLITYIMAIITIQTGTVESSEFRPTLRRLRGVLRNVRLFSQAVTDLTQLLNRSRFKTTRSPDVTHTVKCPASYKQCSDCKSNPKSIDEDGNPIVSESSGIVTNYCNSTIFIAKTPMEYSTGYRTCCRLGMSLITIDSAEEMECLFEPFKASQEKFSFWVNGKSRQVKPTCYYWCPNGVRVSTSVPWLHGEPKDTVGDNECAAVYISPRATGVYPFNCAISNSVMCKGQIKPSNKTVMEKVIPKEFILQIAKYKANLSLAITPNKKSNKTKIRVCYQARKNKKNIILEKKSKPIDNPYIRNNTMTACGRNYFLSTASNATHDYLPLLCAAVYMLPVVIISTEEMNCIIDAYAVTTREYGRSNFRVHAAAYDNNRNTFMYCCSQPFPVQENLWLPNEPNNYFGMEDSVGLILSSSRLGGLVDLASGYPIRYMCEDSYQQEGKLEEMAKLLKDKKKKEHE